MIKLKLKGREEQFWWNQSGSPDGSKFWINIFFIFFFLVIAPFSIFHLSLTCHSGFNGSLYELCRKRTSVTRIRNSYYKNSLSLKVETSHSIKYGIIYTV